MLCRPPTNHYSSVFNRWKLLLGIMKSKISCHTLLPHLYHLTFLRVRIVCWRTGFEVVKIECQPDPVSMSGFFAVICQSIGVRVWAGLPFGRIEDVGNGETDLKAVIKEALFDGEIKIVIFLHFELGNFCRRLIGKEDLKFGVFFGIQG